MAPINSCKSLFLVLSLLRLKMLHSVSASAAVFSSGARARRVGGKFALEEAVAKLLLHST
jgi:hypothetical protein